MSRRVRNVSSLPVTVFDESGAHGTTVAFAAGSTVAFAAGSTVSVAGSNLAHAEAVTPSITQLAGVAARGLAQFVYVGVQGDVALAGSDAVKVEDTFTGANGTSLASHTPEVGGAWTIDAGAIQIQGNRARVTEPSGTSLATIDAGVSDFIARVTQITAGAQALAFRVVDASNLWFARVSGSTLQLYEIDATAATLRGQTAFTEAAPFTIEATCLGDSIVVTGGGVSLSYTSALHQTATRVGLRGTNTLEFDDLLVVDPLVSVTYKNLASGSWHAMPPFDRALPASTATDILAGY